MKPTERDTVLARKRARQDALLTRVKTRRPKLAAKAAAAKPNGPSDTLPTAPEPENADASLASVVTQYVDEYTAAQAEITRQRARLIALRGSEEHLTEDDHEALDNIRDIVTARYERLLEV